MKKQRKLLLIFIAMTVLCRCFALFASASDTDPSVFRRHDNASMKIALTFDDGPHKTLTREILAILKEYGVKATFFVVGVNVKYYPDIVLEICDDGHELGNHTDTHAYLTKYSRDVILREIITAERRICEATDCCPKLLRPPGGIINDDVRELIKGLDYSVILWSIDTRDWAHTPAGAIAENVLDNIRPGDIILMHDFISGNSPTPDALRIIIPALLSRGYQFVTVSELIGSK